MAKVLVAVLAGLGSFLHQRATTKDQLALWGSVAGTASVAALVMGILVAGWLRIPFGDTRSRQASACGDRGVGMGLTWGPVHRHVDPGEGESHAR